MSDEDPSVPDDNRLDSRDVVGLNEDVDGNRREPSGLGQEDAPEIDGTIVLGIGGAGESPRPESSTGDNSSDASQDRATDSGGEEDEPTIVESSLSQPPSVPRVTNDTVENVSNDPTQFWPDQDSSDQRPPILQPDDDGTLVEQGGKSISKYEPHADDTLVFDSVDVDEVAGATAENASEEDQADEGTAVEPSLRQSESMSSDIDVGDDETLPPVEPEPGSSSTDETADRGADDATIIEPKEIGFDVESEQPTLIDQLPIASKKRAVSAQLGDALELPSGVTEQPPKAGSRVERPNNDGTIVLEEPDATAYFDQGNASVAESERNPDGTSSAATAASDVWASQPPESEKRTGEISSEPTSDRYRLIENFAHGGMGNVWRAEDERIRREVAYKELLPDILNDREMVERFLEEAQVTGQLEHPGIVPVYELGRDSKGAPFYAMKLVRGTTMRDAIKAYHAMPPDDGVRHLAFIKLLRNFIDVCHAIAFAHERGVLHRDLKPANVMLGDFGETMVLDWGLAKLIDPLDAAVAAEETIGSLSQSELTTQADATRSEETLPGTHAHDPSHSGSQTAMTIDSILGTSQHSTRHSVKTDVRSRGTETLAGAILGTPHYMSPEQAQTRNSELDARSDIYSLGAILYEILTGNRPVKKDRLRKMLKQIVEGRIIPPRQHLASIPKPIEAVCMKALARRRKNRYQTSHQLVADIEAFLADEPVSVYEEPVQVRLGRWVRKHRTLVSSCAAATLMAVVVFVAWMGIENNRVAKARMGIEAKLAEAAGALKGGKFSQARTLLSDAKSISETDAALADMKPGIVAAEAARISQLQLDVEKTLATTRESQRANKDFGAARAAYTQAIAKLENESSLKPLLKTARDELNLVESTIANQKAEQAALTKFKQFQHEVDDARIYGSLINGDSVDQDLRKAQEYAKSALERYKLDGPNPLSEPLAFLSAKQQEVVRDDGYEMLLLLASSDKLLARRASPEEKTLSAERSLDFVDRAEQLGLRTRIGSLMRASYLESLGRTKEAQDATKVAEVTPNEKAIDYYLLANNSRMQGDLNGAISEYQRALQVDPGHFSSLFLTGLCHLKLGNDDSAISYFTSCISLKPDFVWSFVGRGTAFARLKQVQLAEGDFQQALTIDPKLFAIYTTRGSMHADQEKFAEAIADFQHAMTLSPGHAAPHVLLGETYQIQAVEIEKRLGKVAALATYQKAKDELDAASGLDFNIPRIYRVRGEVNRRMEDFNAALGDYQIALRLESNGDRKKRADDHKQIANIYLSDRDRFADGLQSALREKARIFVPVTFFCETTHAGGIQGSTIFPMPVTIGQSWNTTL
ncbi:MAG: protein kinase, partial [Planctomycetaceae bacterium]|nr:protein kinase [Planctomycetaceae bacterium]